MRLRKATTSHTRPSRFSTTVESRTSKAASDRRASKSSSRGPTPAREHHRFPGGYHRFFEAETSHSHVPASKNGSAHGRRVERRSISRRRSRPLGADLDIELLDHDVPVGGEVAQAPSAYW